jgi:hypothetical protein
MAEKEEREITIDAESPMAGIVFIYIDYVSFFSTPLVLRANPTKIKC